MKCNLVSARIRYVMCTSFSALLCCTIATRMWPFLQTNHQPIPSFHSFEDHQSVLPFNCKPARPTLARAKSKRAGGSRGCKILSVCQCGLRLEFKKRPLLSSPQQYSRMSMSLQVCFHLMVKIKHKSQVVKANLSFETFFENFGHYTIHWKQHR